MIDFPANPTLGQQFTAAGVTWTWDGAKWTSGGQSVAYLPLAGGTMLGPIVLAADPAAALQPATKQYVDGGRLGDNRVVNGDMRIDQRNNGAAGTAINVYTLDRWMFQATQTAKMSWGRYGGGLISGGFANWIGPATSSLYTPLATDYFQIVQRIEADMITDFMFGTAQAKPVTLSFTVNSAVTGTFSGSLSNDQGNRCYPFTYTVAANVWTPVSVTIPGDTAGTWVMNGNAIGAIVRFDLGTGANFRAPAGAWTSVNAIGASGAASMVAQSGGNLNITGVKLEVGSVATPFNHPPLAQALAACQRYYQILGGGQVVCTGYAGAGSAFYTCLPMPVQMRAAPSGVVSGTSYSNASNLTIGTTTINMITTQAAMTATGLGWAGGTIALNAEL